MRLARLCKVCGDGPQCNGGKALVSYANVCPYYLKIQFAKQVTYGKDWKRDKYAFCNSLLRNVKSLCYNKS